MPVVLYLCEYNTNLYSGDIMDFIVKGTFKAGHKWEKFTRKISSPTLNTAYEKIYSLIGSEHRLERRLIKIDSVEEAVE